MKMTKLGYFSEFLVFPPLILIAALYVFHTAEAPRLTTWLIVCTAGLAGWTLFEYFLHRVFFHHAPIVAEIHERHHDDPLEFIGSPAWLSALVGLITVAGPSCALLGFDLGTAATAGIVIGYLWYVFVHYTTHHWQTRHGSYLYRARHRHLRHHYSGDSGNFGVITGLWDHVFGTALDRRAPRSRASAKARLTPEP
jgi:sterol desaturase/sphingolipid hydroxylase (fatty acid hydroxylase superfamily)